MASLVPLKGTTKSRGFYKAVKNKAISLSLYLWPLSEVLIMVGRREGFVQFTEDDVATAQNLC